MADIYKRVHEEGDQDCPIRAICRSILDVELKMHATYSANSHLRSSRMRKAKAESERESAEVEECLKRETEEILKVEPKMTQALERLETTAPLFTLFWRGLMSRTLLARIRSLCHELSNDSKKLSLDSWISIQQACADYRFSVVYRRALRMLDLHPLDIDEELLDRWEKSTCDFSMYLFAPTAEALEDLLDAESFSDEDTDPNISALCKALYIDTSSKTKSTSACTQ